VEITYPDSWVASVEDRALLKEVFIAAGIDSDQVTVVISRATTGDAKKQGAKNVAIGRALPGGVIMQFQAGGNGTRRQARVMVRGMISMDLKTALEKGVALLKQTKSAASIKTPQKGTGVVVGIVSDGYIKHHAQIVRTVLKDMSDADACAALQVIRGSVEEFGHITTTQLTTLFEEASIAMAFSQALSIAKIAESGEDSAHIRVLSEEFGRLCDEIAKSCSAETIETLQVQLIPKKLEEKSVVTHVDPLKRCYSEIPHLERLFVITKFVPISARHAFEVHGKLLDCKQLQRMHNIFYAGRQLGILHKPDKIVGAGKFDEVFNRTSPIVQEWVVRYGVSDHCFTVQTVIAVVPDFIMSLSEVRVEIECIKARIEENRAAMGEVQQDISEMETQLKSARKKLDDLSAEKIELDTKHAKLVGLEGGLKTRARKALETAAASAEMSIEDLIAFGKKEEE
jgi:hypothetical protein